MKHIALISLHTPTATNNGGASALPYHLILFRPKDVKLEVWSYNFNGCNEKQISETAKSLDVEIHIIPIPKWFKLLNSSLVRLLLPRPALNYLNLPKKSLREITDFLNTDSQSGVWIYGEEIARLANKYNTKSIVVTTPDCEAMYYHRVLAMKGVPLRKSLIARYTLMYHRYAKMASSFPVEKNIKYHLVGKADTLFLRRLNPDIDAVFIPHPHYEISTSLHQDVHCGERIKMLIAGRYDFTIAQAVDEAIDTLITLPSEIKSKFKITFLGKDWNKCCEILHQNGFDTKQKGFVEDYAAEVSSHHVQLTPIAVGTGTKGKVLDAFANGLMVIGTPLALENIDAKHGKECVEYSTSDELRIWICKLANDITLVNEIAHAGTNAILIRHSREKIAEQFFLLFI